MNLTHPFPRSLTAAGLALRGALGVATLMGVMLLPAPANALEGDDGPATTVQPSQEELSVEDPAEIVVDDDDDPSGEGEECPEGQLCPGPLPPPPPPPDPCPPVLELQSSPTGDEDCPPEDPCVEIQALTGDRHGGPEDCPPDPCRELPWDTDHGDRERDPENCPEIRCPDVREWLDHGPHGSLGQLEHWQSWYDRHCDDDEDPCDDRVTIEPNRGDGSTDGHDERHPERPEHPDPEDCEPPERTPDPDPEPTPEPVDPPVVAEPTFTG